MNTGCWSSAHASWLSAISAGAPPVPSCLLSSSGSCWAFRSRIYDSRRWQKAVTELICSKAAGHFTCRRWSLGHRGIFFFRWLGLESEGGKERWHHCSQEYLAAMDLPSHSPAPGAALPHQGPSRDVAAGPMPQPAARLPAGTAWTRGPAGDPGNSGTDTRSQAGKKAAANPLRKDANVEGTWSKTSVPLLAAASILHPREDLDPQGCL